MGVSQKWGLVGTAAICTRLNVAHAAHVAHAFLRTFVHLLLVSPSVYTYLSPDKKVAFRKSSMCSQVLLANAPKLGPVLTPQRVHGKSRGHASGTKSYILSPMI